MFKKKVETSSNAFDTLIGSNTKVEGKIHGSGTIRLDGHLIGDLHVDGDAIIGNDGKVEGNIFCNNILISGTIIGNINTEEQLRITNTGELYGDIEVTSFVVDEEAIFEGSCKMKKTLDDNKVKPMVKNENRTEEKTAK